MRKYYRTRTTYAQNYRTQPARSQATIYATAAGEGITSQTCSGAAQGFTSPVVERRRADDTPVYFVESERFPGRYYFLFQQNGVWVFSGDSKLSERYVAKVEAFRAEQMCEVA